VDGSGGVGGFFVPPMAKRECPPAPAAAPPSSAQAGAGASAAAAAEPHSFRDVLNARVAQDCALWRTRGGVRRDHVRRMRRSGYKGLHVKVIDNRVRVVEEVKSFQTRNQGPCRTHTSLAQYVLRDARCTPYQYTNSENKTWAGFTTTALTSLSPTAFVRHSEMGDASGAMNRTTRAHTSRPR